MSEDAANEEASAFDSFMFGYWNQMSPDLYPSFQSALDDFEKMEGKYRFQSLLKELNFLRMKGVFPASTSVRDAYGQPFWSRFDRIVTNDDLVSSSAFTAKFDSEV